LSIGATKDGFEVSPATTFEGRAGQVVANKQIRLRPTASAAPTVPQATDDPATAGAQPSIADNAQPGTKTSGSGSGTSMFSWLLIALGGLLVILGIGAIVLLLRKKDDGDEGDDDGPQVRRGPPPGGARPGYRPADPTMVSRTAVGGPPMGAATMGSPAMAGGRPNNDATAIVRGARMPDDAYGAPPRSPYPPSPGPSYGPSGVAGYGGQPGYLGPPPGGGGYGSEPPPASGYGPPPAGYGPSSRPAAEGYSASDYAGDYGQPRGYGEEPPHRYEAGGYGYEPRGGYDSAGYEGPGYGRSDYDRGPEPPRPGGESSGYGGYYDNDPGPPSSRPAPPRAGERRSLDWLDD
jgi:hypothetical protein